MKMKALNRLAPLLLVFFFVGCSLTTAKLEYNRALRATKDKDYKTALKYYKRVIKRQPDTDIALKAAIEGAQLAMIDVKDFRSSVGLFNYVIIHSQDTAAVKQAQKNIAEIYFSKTSQYKKAIEAYSSLLPLKLSPKERIDIRSRIAKSYFYLNNFFQADVEIKSLLKEDLSDEQRFETLLFKANTLMTLKKHEDASKVLKSLIDKFPQKSLKENVNINLSVCYEEMQDFTTAIQILDDLKGIYPDQEYLDFKISRLKQRKRNMPGARGRVR